MQVIVLNSLPKRNKIFTVLFSYSFQGILNGPDIRKLVASHQQQTFQSMKAVFENFLGNYRAPNYRDIVSNMMDNFEQMNVSMSLKIHLLHQHLDVFPDNLGQISDEHGERFHQQIKKIEERFQGKRVENMLAEFVWYSYEENENERQIHAVKYLRAEENQHRLRNRLQPMDMDIN